MAETYENPYGYQCEPNHPLSVSSTTDSFLAAMLGDSLHGRYSPSGSRGSLSRASSPGAASAHLDPFDGQDPAFLQARALHAPSMRRAATETQVKPDSPTLRAHEAMQRDLLTDEKRSRRHSFNCVRDVPAFDKIMSARRMKLDVDLHATYHELRKREQQLEKLVEALKVSGATRMVSKQADTTLRLWTLRTIMRLARSDPHCGSASTR